MREVTFFPPARKLELVSNVYSFIQMEIEYYTRKRKHPAPLQFMFWIEGDSRDHRDCQLAAINGSGVFLNFDV